MTLTNTFRSTLAIGALGLAFGAGMAPNAAEAQERYVGEIFMGGWNFCPRGSTGADGQLLPISQNSALFSLYGTMYGGDGRTTFGLPDLRGRVAIHDGNGPGLSDRQHGQKGGSETNVLNTAQMPNHTHTLNGTTESGNNNTPTGRLLAVDGNDNIYRDTASGLTPMKSQAVGNTGGGQAVNNMQPYLVIRYCVQLVGLFPSRN